MTICNSFLLSNGSSFSGTGWKWHDNFCFGSEVPLVGAPLTYMPGMNPAVAGHIPPGQLVLKDAHVVLQRDWPVLRPRAVILTSDGEMWTASGRQQQCI